MIQGFVELVQAFRIQGWVFDSDRPLNHLRVEIACGDMRLGGTRADIFREDLKEGGIGHGDHAFVFDFLDVLDSEDLSNLTVRVVTPDGAVLLPRLVYTPMETVYLPEAVEPVFGDPISDTDQHPLFILGSARSGTSAFSEAIVATGKFWGQAEGHMLDIVAHLRDSVRAFYAQKEREGAIDGENFISRVPMESLQVSLRRLFVDMMRATVPSPYWFDKTPNHNMIQMAPHFLAMWPNAKFVFLKRRAFEFLESRRRKFPDLSFEENCRAWAVAMQSWAAVRDQLDGRAMEIDQLYLAMEPETVARQVADFLELDSAQAQSFLDRLRDGRPQLTGASPAAVLHADALEWSAPERATFDQVCAPLMERFGYATDTSYRVPGDAHRWLEVPSAAAR